MDDEQQERLERVGEQIMHFLAPEDPLERKKLIGAIELGQRLAEYLQCEIADEDTFVDTGSDGSSYDCNVKVNGREFHVNTRAGDTDEEVEQWYEDQQAGAREWDEVWPRVRQILVAADAELTERFEKLLKS